MEDKCLMAFRPIHPFPARMAPSIALEALNLSLRRRPLTVLDPMVGSGTTVVAARSKGHAAIGFDTDPLAVLLASCWSSDIEKEAATTAGKSVLRNARRRYQDLRQRDSYPDGADEETRKFLRYWFDVTNRTQLRALADAISKVSTEITRNICWCAFSRLIIAKSRGASRAMDLSHSRPHRAFERGPLRPFEGFLEAVQHIANNAAFRAPSNERLAATVSIADARKLPLDAASVDLVITSPPYLNAIDYLRCSKFSLVWMGHTVDELRKLRAANIGTEVARGVGLLAPPIPEVLAALEPLDALPERWKGVLGRYVQDMDTVVAEMARVLKPGGEAVLVVGDSTVRGVFIRNSVALLTLAARHGMTTLSTTRRELPPSRRYLPPPSTKSAGDRFSGRMREEVVLRLQASS